MHFVFAITTISSITGAALGTTSISEEITANVNFAYKNGADQSHRRVSRDYDLRGYLCTFKNVMDFGILKCNDEDICEFDDTSPTGARCVNWDNFVSNSFVDEEGNGAHCTIDCYRGKICIEDYRSSFIGRCVNPENTGYASMVDEGTECTFANGTVGIKCRGP